MTQAEDRASSGGELGALPMEPEPEPAMDLSLVMEETESMVPPPSPVGSIESAQRSR